MGFWQGLGDFLKKLIPQDISLLKNCSLINITKNITIDKITHDESSKTLTLNLAKLNQEERKEIEKLIPQALEENSVIIKSDAKDLIDSLISEEQKPDSQKLMAFLQSTVPKNDLIMWRAALFLRDQFNSHMKIDQLKNDMVQKYGTKGRNIANLCSAGYLESHLIPLFDALKNSFGEDEAKQKFLEIYSLIVNELPFTIFVHSHTKFELVREEIITKLRSGVKTINIHGIGRENQKTVRKTVEYFLDNKDFKVEPIVSEEGKVVFAKLLFKD